MKRLILLVLTLGFFFISCNKGDCTNGIKDGNEIEIDCGGDCLPCPTCFDGIKNQDEVGIDCGGSCCTSCPIEYPETGTYGLNILHGDDNLVLSSGKSYSFKANVPEGSKIKIKIVSTNGGSWEYDLGSLYGWVIYDVVINVQATLEVLNSGTADFKLNAYYFSDPREFEIRYYENGDTETKRKTIRWQS